MDIIMTTKPILKPTVLSNDVSEREKFEAWYTKEVVPRLTGCSSLLRSFTWQAWQAATAQQEYSTVYTISKIDECNNLNIGLAQQAETIASMQSTIDELKANAERYRFIRDNDLKSCAFDILIDQGSDGLDNRIDQAISARNEKAQDVKDLIK